MNSLFSRFGLIAATLVFLSTTAIVTAATYTVGGTGANFPTLEALRTSGVLQDGDTIVLNRNDNSFTAPFANTLTIKGAGNISSTSTRFFGDSNKDVTLNSNSLEFSGRASITARNIEIASGTNTFSDNNWAATENARGGAINGTTIITDGFNTFSGNLAGPNIGGSGGAIFGNTILAGGTNLFYGNSAWFGGAICGNVDITGGINTFADNKAGRNAMGSGYL